MVLHSAVFSRRRLAKARYACYDLEPYINLMNYYLLLTI